MSIGTVAQLPAAVPHLNTNSLDCEPSAFTCKTDAAAAPLPSALAENNPGATVSTRMSPTFDATVTCARPATVPAGTTKFTCVGADPSTTALRSAPVLSLTT